MTQISRLLLVSPGRTSSGGSAFSTSLAEAIGQVSDVDVETTSLPPAGKAELPTSAGSADAVVFLGARTTNTAGAFSVFWPLNVAPLDNSVSFLRHTSVRNRARQVALRSRLGVSVRRADALCFGSHYARSLYLANYPAAAQLPYKIIAGGTPSLPIEPREPDPTSDTRLVFCCSHLYPYKGILQLVRAIAEVRHRLPSNVTVRIAGADRDPNYAAAVHAEIRERNLADLIKVAAANQAELQTLYQSAEVAVFPSACENAGSFALFDGLHHRIPTICSDRSSMPEMARDATLLVNPYQEDRLGDAIVRVLTDRDLQTDLRMKAQKWSETAPTWRHRAQSLLDFISVEKDGHRR